METGHMIKLSRDFEITAVWDTQPVPDVASIHITTASEPQQIGHLPTGTTALRRTLCEAFTVHDLDDAQMNKV